MTSQTHDTKTADLDRWWTEVVPQLPANLDAQAAALGALHRHRAFATASDLLRGLLAYVLGAMSFRYLGVWGVLVPGIDIAASSWQQRLRAAGPWLHWLANTLLAAPPAPWLQGRRHRVLLVDSTTVGRVGGTGDDWRIQLGYDLGAGQITQFGILPRTTGEGLARFQLTPGDLVVADSGYGRRADVAYAVAQRADVLLRIYLPSCPLQTAQGQPLDLVTHMQRRGAVPLEVWAVVQHAGQAIPVRVLAVPLPPDRAAAARRRLYRTAQRKGRTPSATGVLLAGWLVLLTTCLDAEAWSMTELVQLYRARWQIELVFKRLKQLLDLHTLRCRTNASLVPLLSAYLVAWLLGSGVATELRPIMQQAAVPAPATLPGCLPETDAVVSSWDLSHLGLDLLRQQVWGQWTWADIQAHLTQLIRHLVSHPREQDREHQETVIRMRLTGRRYTPARPLPDAEHLNQEEVMGCA